MAATVSEAVFPGAHAGPARRAAAVRGAEAGVNFNATGRRWRWKTMLTDSVELLGIVLSIPLAMALVGTPIALAIALLLWMGRLVLSGF